MNFLDLVLVVLLVLVCVRGGTAGITMQVPTVLGFSVGIAVGAGLAPFVVDAVGSPLARALIVVPLVLVPAVVLGIGGELLGRRLADDVADAGFRWLDRTLGVVGAAALSVLFLWLLVDVGRVAQQAPVGSVLGSSAVLRSASALLPPPPPLVGQVERLLEPVAVGVVSPRWQRELLTPVDPPSPAAVDAAARQGRAATVRVSGVACGDLLEGSGVVVADGLVATNAHVVAGVRRSLVETGAGTLAADPLVVDPLLDVALLRVPGLGVEPLTLAGGRVDRGSEAAVIGFPTGGPLQVAGAVVRTRYEATGTDIYGRERLERDVYVLQTQIRPGNSGGPVVLPDGSVLGLVFGRAIRNAGIGYAVPADEVAALVASVDVEQSPSVDTGACLPSD